MTLALAPSSCVEQFAILPKFSIVCVVNNQASDLMKWMRCAMQSTSNDWEMVIVDAGSLDGGFELVAAIEKMDPRIRLLPNSQDDWLEVLRQASDRTLGEFVIVQFPGTALPDLDMLASHAFDQSADVVDIRQAGGGSWPACRRGYWIHSAIDAAAHQPSNQITEMLLLEGARVGVCSAQA